jgi:hypothetical protein
MNEAEREYRLGSAAMWLARDQRAYQVLTAGQPVARSRLHANKLLAIGEPIKGEPLALDDALALSVEGVRLDVARTEQLRQRADVEPRSLRWLLDAIEVFIRRFVVINEAQATANTLWVVHTWAIEAAQATPYVFVNSPEPESGKTRLLEVLRELVCEPLLTMNISDAALFRVIESRQPSLFFDEIDAVFNPKARERGHRDDLRSLLNAGYRRGERVYRMGGGNNTTLESFAAFGPKAFAGIGTLPPTLASRCIRIEMKRRRVDEPVEDFY